MYIRYCLCTMHTLPYGYGSIPLAWEERVERNTALPGEVWIVPIDKKDYPHGSMIEEAGQAYEIVKYLICIFKKYLITFNF